MFPDLFKTNHVSFLFPSEPIILEYTQENFMGVEEVRSTIIELQSGIDKKKLEKFEQNIEKRLAEMENVIIKKCREDNLDKQRSINKPCLRP